MRGHRHRLPGRTRTGAVSRPASLLVLLATALFQFTTALPEAGVAHVRCPEHGELTHADGRGDGSARALSSRLSRRGVHLTTVVEDSSPTPGAHQHCPYAAVLDQPPPALSAAGGIGAVAMVPAAMRSSHATTPCPPRRLVLDSAPKTSPPRPA